MKVIRKQTASYIKALSTDFNSVIFDGKNNVKEILINKYKEGALKVHGIYSLKKIPTKLNQALKEYIKDEQLTNNE